MTDNANIRSEAVDAAAKPTILIVDDEPNMLEPTTLRMLNDRLKMLLNPRTSPVARFGFVETIAGLTDRVDDLAPDQAAALATYLVGKKRVEEHRAILPHVEELGKWKQVRLAVADQLALFLKSKGLDNPKGSKRRATSRGE